MNSELIIYNNFVELYTITGIGVACEFLFVLWGFFSAYFFGFGGRAEVVFYIPKTLGASKIWLCIGGRRRVPFLCFSFLFVSGLIRGVSFSRASTPRLSFGLLRR